ncbi:hypothetical protein JXQ70_10840 [bacterium]|nr:hypothetical protein [bacterium]
MKKPCLFFMFSFICFSSVLAQSTRWMPVDGGSYQLEEPRITTLSSGSSRIFFEVSVPGFLVQERMTKDGMHHELVLPGQTSFGEIGQASLPLLRLLVEIPYEAELGIQLADEETVEYPLSYFGIENMLSPVQESIPKTADGYRDWKYSIDKAYYEQNSFMPEERVTIGQINFYRGHRVAQIDIRPLSYNPRLGIVRVNVSLSFELIISGGTIAKTVKEIQRTWSDDFEEQYATQFINYGMFQERTSAEEVKTGYSDGLLIVTDSSFIAEINQLVQWRKKMGFKVYQATTVTTGSTVSEIKTYIQNQYNSWSNPSLSYVLLVGDTAQIPTPLGAYCSNCASDSDYACLSGSDNIPDVYIGRISVENDTQALDVISRIMTFTKAQYTATSWLKKACFSSSCDEAYNSVLTHEYCLSTYTKPNGYTGTYYPGGTDPGGDLIRCIEDYAGDGNAAGDDVVSAMNLGRSLITYSGHGGYTSWSGPYVSTSDIQNATCGEKTPFMIGHCCIAHNILYSSPCFGEICLREAAIGYFGSSESSFWGEDDYLQRTWFSKIFDSNQLRIGQFMTNALIDFYNNYPSRQDYYLDMEILGGDPTMELYTEIPVNLSVSHGTSFDISNDTSLTVTVYRSGSPLSGARVCIIKEDGGDAIHEYGVTNTSGVRTIYFNPLPGQYGTMQITVTAQNSKPYEGTIDVYYCPCQ